MKLSTFNNKYFSIILLLLIFQATILYLMDRVLICKCKIVKFWHGITYSSENSQHLTDWYTFSHIIHGFFFYYLIYLIIRGSAGTQSPSQMAKRSGRASSYWLKFINLLEKNIWLKLAIAIIPEVIWEIVENTPLIINRYRTATISLDYYGDSIINSVCDTVAMVLGFWLAYRLPVWATIALTVSMELFVLFFIRDNLTLNIIMLLFG